MVPGPGSVYSNVCSAVDSDVMGRANVETADPALYYTLILDLICDLFVSHN
jgi:hypothetical protein